MVIYNTQLVDAMLPPSLPLFTYEGVVDDLNEYLKKKVPLGYRNVVLFSRKVIIKSDINFRSDYYHVPVELLIVCETLEVVGNVSINLSGESAPDLVSFHDVKNGHAWKGKAGCDGGSIYIYANTQVGDGRLSIDVHGGNGGKGQDGYPGKNGACGEDVRPLGGPSDPDGKNGENGGDGGRGGKGGDAGKIEIHIHSLANNEFSFISLNTNAGEGGRGGNGGKGGAGGLGGRIPVLLFFYFSGRSGSNGKDGECGPNGKHGQGLQPLLNHASDEKLFYESIPITAAYLQRALNAEVLHVLRAKLKDDKLQLLEAKSSIAWISKIAHCNGYDVIQKRCTESLEYCGQTTNLCKNPIKIKAGKLRSHFEVVKQLANKYIGLTPVDLHLEAKSDQSLAKYAHHVKLFNHLYSQFNSNKARLARAQELAAGLNVPPFDYSDKGRFARAQVLAAVLNVKKDLQNTSFTEHVNNHLMKAAKSKSFLTDALQGEDTTEVLVDSSEVLVDEGLSAVSDAAMECGLAALTTEAVVAPELVVAEVVVAVTVFAAVEAISYLVKGHEEALAEYEVKLHARARLEAKNQERLKFDERKQDPPERRYQRRCKEQRKGESGKFIGVLDKCDLVEDSSTQVVATFDAIPLEFTTKTQDQKVDVNSLDSTQQIELMEQLSVQGLLFSPLPTFYITTTLNKGVVSENQVGQWFEFDAEFVGSGRSEALEITTILLLPLLVLMGKLQHGASAVTGGDIPVTVKSVQRLKCQLQNQVILELGLSHKGSLTDRTLGDAEEPQLPQHESTIEAVDFNTFVQGVLVANVGQGSCNILYNEQGSVCLVYDAGYGNSDYIMHNQIIGLINSSPIIVLSHWHKDHFRYLLAYPNLVLGKTVIVPDYGSRWGTSVKRVRATVRITCCSSGGAFQHYFGDTYINKQIPSPGNISNLDIRVTVIPELEPGRNKNNVGAIIMCVKNRQGRPFFLMPGDASFSYVANEQKQNLKYLLATHHGSTHSISGTEQNSIPQGPNGGNGTVIFSYGRNNQYDHNVLKALPFYRNKGWEHFKTTVRSGLGIKVEIP